MKEASIVFKLGNFEEVKTFLGRKGFVKNKKLYVSTPVGKREVRIGNTVVKNKNGTCYVMRSDPFTKC